MNAIVASVCLLALAPAAAPGALDWTGRWAGAMDSDRGKGGMAVTFTRDGTTGWKADFKLRPDGRDLPTTVEAVKIDGDRFTLTAKAGDIRVELTGKRQGDRLAGNLTGWKNERKGVEGTFALQRGGEMPAAARPTGGGSGQRADPSFDPRVANPAYAKDGPKVMFDEAHHNFHTAGGRYKGFADLITSDGYQVVPNRERFTAAALSGYRILVIANAIGGEALDSPQASQPAFSDQECDVVRDWVRAGGSLLLITDHAPTGAANQILAQRFGVEMSKGATSDDASFDREAGRGSLVFARAKGTLADHPVTRGRNERERVDRVMTFTGQSLKGPAGSAAFMKLADTAVDEPPGGGKPTSAAGRAQGIALQHGKGRVVMLGEAAMLSAQVAGDPPRPFGGLNRPGIDNRQLALNVVHWLSGLTR
jgi:hypothetical protein